MCYVRKQIKMLCGTNNDDHKDRNLFPTQKELQLRARIHLIHQQKDFMKIRRFLLLHKSQMLLKSQQIFADLKMNCSFSNFSNLSTMASLEGSLQQKQETEIANVLDLQASSIEDLKTEISEFLDLGRSQQFHFGVDSEIFEISSISDVMSVDEYNENS